MPNRTLARIEMQPDGVIVVASNLPPGPLVAALAAALTQVSGYIPAPPASRKLVSVGDALESGIIDRVGASVGDDQAVS